MIDLHSHSSASDGILSPADSARYAFEKKLTVWALLQILMMSYKKL